MKNIFLFLILLFQSVLFGQTVLNTYSLNLKNPEQTGQILTAQNTTTQDVFAFITDSKSVTLLQYNKALFLTNQLAASRLNVENKTIIGYSFGEDQQPTLYWSSEDFKIIVLTKYDMVNKTLKASKFSFPESTQELINTFQKNNSFYILSKDKTAQALTLYAFKNDSVVQKSLDFSTFQFQNKNTQFVTFNQFIRDNPIEKMETDDYNPLSKTVQKSKVYIADNRLILTFDQNPRKTQVFEINLETYEVKEKNFLQTVTQKAKKNSNTFFLDDKIYQINATDEELYLDIKDYTTEKTIKSVKISKLDTIQFKNSPLFLQIEDRKPREIKKTSTFLKQLSGLDLGISAYKSRQNTYLTIGGTPKFGRFYNSYFDDYGNLQMNFASLDQTANIYFESILNPNFEFIQEMQMPFAMDNIYYFLNENKKITVQNTLTLKNYSILGYYDPSTKQFIMRKFTDGFINDDPGNPIMNKSILSQPFQFEKP